jgi:ornithine carbamoyltransferase
MARPFHLMTLADLSAEQINRLITHSVQLKSRSLPWLSPQIHGAKATKMRLPSQSLFGKSIALLFSKRSTRTRLAAETSAEILGGKTIFLGRDDIQLGVNESLKDTARIIGGMCQGIFARVGEHKEIEVGFSDFILKILN